MASPPRHHNCPGGCGTPVPQHHLACSACWRRLPQGLKNAVNHGWKRRHESTRVHQAAVRAAVEWYRDQKEIP